MPFTPPPFIRWTRVSAGDLALPGERIVADLSPPAAAAAISGLLAYLAGEPRLRWHFRNVISADEQSLIAELLERA